MTYLEAGLTSLLEGRAPLTIWNGAGGRPGEPTARPLPSTRPQVVSVADPAPAQATDGASIDVAALFVEHGPFLLRSVQRMAGQGPHVEDVVQEVFLVAHRRRAELAAHPAVRGWLFRVAQNLVQHHRRSVARKLRLADAVSDAPRETRSEVSGPVRAAQERDQVRQLVAALPEHEQAVFVLYELEELTGQEIASILDLPPGTVWTRLRAARQHFREAWLALEQQSATRSHGDRS